jgi:rfaE bifunctional protein nucleotidyltransferase chain/domain
MPRPCPILTRDEAALLSIELRASRKRLVLTNGVFDVLHAGHIAYLEAARELGDCLLVGLNIDATVRALKGPDRPLVPQEDRARVLTAIRYVDGIVFFDEPTASALISALKPAVYVKGGDYSTDDSRAGVSLPEAPAVRAYGGEIVILPYLQGRSTTSLVTRIRASQS